MYAVFTEVTRMSPKSRLGVNSYRSVQPRDIPCRRTSDAGCSRGRHRQDSRGTRGTRRGVTTPVAPNDFATHAPNGVPTQNPATRTIARSAAGAHAEVPFGARQLSAPSDVLARRSVLQV